MVHNNVYPSRVSINRRMLGMLSMSRLENLATTWRRSFIDEKNRCEFGASLVCSNVHEFSSISSNDVTDVRNNL